MTKTNVGLWCEAQVIPSIFPKISNEDDPNFELRLHISKRVCNSNLVNMQKSESCSSIDHLLVRTRQDSRRRFRLLPHFDFIFKHKHQFLVLLPILYIHSRVRATDGLILRGRSIRRRNVRLHRSLLLLHHHRRLWLLLRLHSLLCLLWLSPRRLPRHRLAHHNRVTPCRAVRIAHTLRCSTGLWWRHIHPRLWLQTITRLHRHRLHDWLPILIDHRHRLSSSSVAWRRHHHWPARIARRRHHHHWTQALHHRRQHHADRPPRPLLHSQRVLPIRAAPAETAAAQVVEHVWWVKI